MTDEIRTNDGGTRPQHRPYRRNYRKNLNNKVNNNSNNNEINLVELSDENIMRIASDTSDIEVLNSSPETDSLNNETLNENLMNSNDLKHTNSNRRGRVNRINKSGNLGDIRRSNRRKVSNAFNDDINVSDNVDVMHKSVSTRRRNANSVSNDEIDETVNGTKVPRRGRPARTNPRNVSSTLNEKRYSERTNIKVARDRLKIIPLGGIEEIGKNMTVFEYGDDMILVDCGVAFPEDEMLGVDLVIPDFSYLLKNKSKLRGMVITHGHEDHIGSIPYVLKEINTPVYATRLTLGLIKNKLEEHKLVRSTAMKCVKAGDVITLGNFKIEFIRVNHSIADSVALAITTPVGTVVHTGDFKVDYTPIDGNLIDLARFAELGKNGVLALMSDSTNAERPGYTMSESTVGKVFDGLFAGCQKRIIVATFASNVHRVQQVVNSAMKNNRKVAICGRSMENVMNVAKELGYLDIPDGVLIDMEEIDEYPPEKLTLITTGSQGEEMSGLSRMASGTHRKVTITNQDLVIISATPIPGNEKLVSNVIDDLFKIGAEVVYHTLKDIHVSGHACQEEQKLMLSLVKPKYFIPVHGEFRHLQAHAQTAVKVGVDPDNIVMLSNGSILELDKNFCRITGSIPAGQILVDGLGVGDVGNIVLRDRQHLSQDGLIIVVIAMNGKTGEIMSGPDVISRGFVYVRESEDLMDAMRKEIVRDVQKIQIDGIKEWSIIKNRIKDTVHDFVYAKTRRNPMIIPIISEI